MLAFSPDGQLLTIGQKDGTLRVFNAATWQELLHAQAHRDAIQTVGFSPDVRGLVSGDQDGVAWQWSIPAP